MDKSSIFDDDTLTKLMTKTAICEQFVMTPYRFEALKKKHKATVIAKQGNKNLYSYIQGLNIIDDC